MKIQKFRIYMTEYMNMTPEKRNQKDNNNDLKHKM